MALTAAADQKDGWGEIHDRLASEDAERMRRLNESIERSTRPHVRRWKIQWAAEREARRNGTPIPKPRRSIQLDLFATITP